MTNPINPNSRSIPDVDLTKIRGMTNLIAQLTIATGPNVELDAAIEMAIYPDATAPDECLRVLQIALDERAEPPNYTGSIDAATKAIPDGWCLYILCHADHGWFANVYKLGDRHKVVGPLRRSPSAPLAICIAAMKAREV